MNSRVLYLILQNLQQRADCVPIASSITIQHDFSRPPKIINFVSPFFFFNRICLFPPLCFCSCSSLPYIDYFPISFLLHCAPILIQNLILCSGQQENLALFNSTASPAVLISIVSIFLPSFSKHRFVWDFVCASVFI